jgi:hypothetical protein
MSSIHDLTLALAEARHLVIFPETSEIQVKSGGEFITDG